MTDVNENDDNIEDGPDERSLSFWLRAASRTVRAQFGQAARGGAESLATVATEIDARIAGAVSPEDYATTAATLKAIARKLGWDESASGTSRGRGEHGRGFGRGFGAGFDRGVEHGTDAEDGHRFAGGFHPGFRPDSGLGFHHGFHPGFHPGFEPGFRGHHGHGHHGRRGRRGFGSDATATTTAESSYERGFEAGFRAASGA
jgi:hypothetical protein